ncbi:NmrA family NAD(P)-binding protein [Novosphingobium colocasiae]
MVAESVREVGTGHFIYQSAQIGGSRGVLSVGGKRAIEERIAELHLDATILRPAWFMDNFLTYFPVTENDGTLVVAMAMPTDVPLALVCSDDIGRAAAAVFANPDAYRNAEIDLVGDVGSTAQMAATIGEIAGRPAVAVEVPMAAIEEHWPQGVDLYKWLATKPAENDTGPLTALVGSPIGFRAWAQEKLAPRPAGLIGVFRYRGDGTGYGLTRPFFDYMNRSAWATYSIDSPGRCSNSAQAWGSLATPSSMAVCVGQ